MMSMRAPGLRYVEPAVATTVANTLGLSSRGAHSSSDSKLVSSRALCLAVGMVPFSQTMAVTRSGRTLPSEWEAVKIQLNGHQPRYPQALPAGCEHDYGVHHV